MTELEKRIESLTLIPVIRIERVEDAAPLAKALSEGGLPVAEVTFRTDCAADAIREMKRACPEMLVGAGTVLTPEQADAAQAAGAEFIVSPGLNPDVVEHCLEKGMPIIPGCATPSEVEAAISYGLTTVKFFPAEAAGGVGMIRAMSAPYRGIRFMPTGGITPENIGAYLACPAVLACGGSFTVSENDLRTGNFDAIREKTAAALKKIFDFKLYHVGISAGNTEKAARDVALLSTLFGQPIVENPGAYFFGNWFEVIKETGRGEHGSHIGISTPHIDRAVAYFERLGYEFDYEGAGYDEKGNITVIYFKENILGFAFHLSRAQK